MRDAEAPEPREVRVDDVLRRVMALAETQHSVVTLDDMRTCGADKSWVYRQVKVGMIHRLGPSTYGVAGIRRSFVDRAMAVVASVRGPALVSHRSAAYLHGFERVLEPLSVEITVPRHRRPQPRPGTKVHESLAFDLAGPNVCDGVPVTGVARTILDCAPAEEKPIRLLDDALRRKTVTWEDLWGCYLAHNVRGRNVRPYRDILLERDGNTPPGGEFARRMAGMLAAGGVPTPVFEHRVVVGGHEYYLDLAWPARMVAVECNDAGSHETPKAFRRDPMKRNRCERAGWLYLEFTWWDMVHESAEVLAHVAAALEARH